MRWCRSAVKRMPGPLQCYSRDKFKGRTNAPKGNTLGYWAAWAPAVITLLGIIFMAGQITGRIKDQEITIKDHDGRLDGHDATLGQHAIAIARAESWREGYNAGKGK